MMFKDSKENKKKKKRNKVARKKRLFDRKKLSEGKRKRLPKKLTITPSEPLLESFYFASFHLN